MRLVIKCIFSFVGLIMALYSCTKPTPVGPDSQDPIETPEQFKEYLFALEGADFYKEGAFLNGFVLGPTSTCPVVSEVIIPEGEPLLYLKIDNPEGLCTGDTLVVYSPALPSEEQQTASQMRMSIPSVQQQVGDFFDAYNFPMVGSFFVDEKLMGDGRKELAGAITMNPLYAIARVDICVMQPSFVGQMIDYVSFTSNGIAGDFQCDITSDDFELASLGDDVVTTEVSDLSISSVGQITSVYMAVAPGTYSGTLTVKTDGVELVVPIESVLFERACTTPMEVFIQGDIIGGAETFNPFEGFDWMTN